MSGAGKKTASCKPDHLQTISPGAQDAVREARRMLHPLKNEIVQLLQTLVQTNSVAIPPGGSETGAQKVLYQLLKTYDLNVEMYDVAFLNHSVHPYIRHERNYADRHNLIARLSGTGRGRSLLLSGHMDTVPPGRVQWKENPWSGLIRGQRLYGRGSYDMKGGLVAAFSVALALKRAGLRLGGDLLCESVIDEEWAGGGGTLAARLRGDVADVCVIPEPTDLSIFRASRGGYFVDVTVSAGDPENYFSKGEVISPALPMGRLLGWIDSWSIKRRRIDPGKAYAGFSDAAPVQILALEANRFDADVPWSVPLIGRLRVYFQFLPYEDVAAVIQEVRESFHLFCEQDPFFSVYQPEWKAIVDPPLLGHELSLDHDWTQCLFRNATAALGTAPPMTAAAYPCDAFINQREFGIPTLIFGPSGAAPHNANEYVEVNSVFQTAEVLLATALEWCQGSA